MFKVGSPNQFIALLAGFIIDLFEQHFQAMSPLDSFWTTFRESLAVEDRLHFIEEL